MKSPLRTRDRRTCPHEGLGWAGNILEDVPVEITFELKYGGQIGIVKRIDWQPSWAEESHVQRP